MKPFEIIRELTEAEDAWVFLLIGFVISAAAGVLFYRQKIRAVRAGTSAAVYAVCELLMDTRIARGISGSFAVFVIGLYALGSAAGFGTAFLIGKLTGKKDRFIA